MALVFRMGLHLGKLNVDGEDLCGDGVNIAASPPGNTDAYDCYLGGLACLSSMSADNLMKAMHLFQKASALDAGYAVAYAMTMSCHVHRSHLILVEDIELERSEVTRLLHIVMMIGQEDGVVLSHAPWALASILRDLASSKRLVDRAVALNPNLAIVWTNRGSINVWSVHPDIALEHGRAQRPDPSGISLPRWSAMAKAEFVDEYAQSRLAGLPE